MLNHWRCLVTVGVVVLCGCGPTPASPAPGEAAAPPSPRTAPQPPFTLWARATAPAPDGSLLLLRSSGATVRDFGAGVPTSDGRRVLATAQTATATVVHLVDTSTGTVLEEWRLPPNFHLPGIGPLRSPVALAPGDRFAVLQEGSADPGTIRTRSRFAVVDLAHGGAVREGVTDSRSRARSPSRVSAPLPPMSRSPGTRDGVPASSGRHRTAASDGGRHDHVELVHHRSMAESRLQPPPGAG